MEQVKKVRDKIWKKEFVVERKIDVVVYLIVGFIQKGQRELQTQIIDFFSRPTLPNALCKFDTANHPDARKNCDFAFAGKSRANGVIVLCHRLLVEDLQTYVSQNPFSYFHTLMILQLTALVIILKFWTQANKQTFLLCNLRK